MPDKTELTIAQQEQNYIKEFISLKEALLETLEQDRKQKHTDEAEPTLGKIAGYLLKVFFDPPREKFASKSAAEINSFGFAVSITDGSLSQLKDILRTIFILKPKTLEDLSLSTKGLFYGITKSISSKEIEEIGWFRKEFYKALSEGDAYFTNFANQKNEETTHLQISKLNDNNKILKAKNDSLREQLKKFEQIKAENEKLKNDAKKLGPREKENMFATIGAMYEILIGETNRKSVFSSPEELMMFLCDNYDKRHEGFSRSTLFEKFKIAKKTINKNK